MLFLVSFEDDNEGAILQQLHTDEARSLVKFEVNVVRDCGAGHGDGVLLGLPSVLCEGTNAELA